MSAPTGIVQFVQDVSQNGAITGGQQVNGIISKDNGFDSGTRPALSFNGDFTDGYGANSTNAWVGINTGLVGGAVPTAAYIAPRDYDGDYGVRLQGFAPPTTIPGVPGDGSNAVPIIEGSNDGTNWTPLASGDGTYYSQRGYFNKIPISGASGYQYFRVRTGNYYGECEEFRVEGIYTTGVPWRPARPVISPAGARLKGGMDTISITCPTGGTGLLIYFTTDGTTPVVTAGVPQGTTTLYTGTFTLSTNTSAPYNVYAIANGHGMTGITTESSEVSHGAYWALNHQSFVPDPFGFASFGSAKKSDWTFDTNGRLVEAHSGTLFFDTTVNKWYLVGFNANLKDSPETVGDVPPRGIWAYWFQNNGLTFTPVTTNDSPSRTGMILPPCPVTWLTTTGKYMSSQTRTRILQNDGASDPGKKRTMFNHVDTQEGNYNAGEVGVCIASAVEDVWSWYIHWNLTINGTANYRVNDLALFEDPADGTKWLIIVTGNPGTDDTGNNTGIYAVQLDPATDYTTPKQSGGSAVAINLFPSTSSVKREGIKMIYSQGAYILLHGKLFAYFDTADNDLRQRTNTGGTSLLTSTWSTGAPTSDASVWASTPGSNDIINHCQITDIVAVPGTSSGSFIVCFDAWTATGASGDLSGSRYAWTYLLPADITTGVIALPTTRYKWGMEVFTSDLASGSVSTSNVLNTSFRSTTTAGTGGQLTVLYQFQRAPDNSNSPGTWANVGTASSVLFFDNTGLTPATKYWTRVIKMDAMGNSVTSSAVSVTTTSDITAPTVPGGYSAAPGAPGTVRVSLSWTASTDDQTPQNQIVYRIYKDASLYDTTSGGVTSWSEVVAADNSTHTYAVSAVDLANNESAETTARNVKLALPASGGGVLRVGMGSMVGV